MRALFVPFYFPPTAGGGVERTLAFLRHLPDRGVDCEVLCPVDARWLAEDPASLGRVPDGLRVHRIPFRGPDKRILPRERIALARPGVRRVGRRLALLPQRLLVPDSEVMWAFDLVPAAVRLLSTGRFDVFVTTAPPHSMTANGAVIRGRVEVPWVADWRDPWLGHADLRLDSALVRAKQALAGRVALLAARRMDGASCVSYAADEIRRLAPGVDLEVIDNGVEVGALSGYVRQPDPGRFTITFTGYLFGDRGPDRFLDALGLVLDRRPDIRGSINVRFIGGFRDEDRARVERLGLKDIVESLGTRTHDEALRAQRDADCLLLLMQDAAGRGASFVPAKTWEYLDAARPVLGLVPPDGAAARELGAAGGCEVIAPDDVAGCASALERLYAAWERGDVVQPRLAPDVAARISRQAGADRMAGLLRRVVERHGA